MHPSSKVKQSKGKASQRQCRICDAPAQYSYFGSISCYSCKMFFRRNAVSKQNRWKCQSIGQCRISVNAGHKCSACRLAKCFDSGMSADRFRPTRRNQQKSDVPTDGRKQELSKHLWALNHTPLTDDQWTLLFQLRDAYNESELVRIGQRLRDTHNDLQQSFAVYDALVEEFLAAVYEITGRYLRVNSDLRKLPFHQRSVLLRNAADNVACMIAVLGMARRRLYDLNDFAHFMSTKYGRCITERHQLSMAYVDPDIVISRTAISLFAMSESACTPPSNIPMDFLDSRVTLHLQNKYVEVLWKYLLHRYNDRGAVHRFLNMIVWFMSLKMLTHHARSSAAHVNDVESVIEQTELTLLLVDVEEIF